MRWFMTISVSEGEWKVAGGSRSLPPAPWGVPAVWAAVVFARCQWRAGLYFLGSVAESGEGRALAMGFQLRGLPPHVSA